MLTIVVAKLLVMLSRCLHGFTLNILAFIYRYIHIADIFVTLNIDYITNINFHFLGGTEIFGAGPKVLGRDRNSGGGTDTF